MRNSELGGRPEGLSRKLNGATFLSLLPLSLQCRCSVVVRHKFDDLDAGCVPPWHTVAQSHKKGHFFLPLAWQMTVVVLCSRDEMTQNRVLCAMVAHTGTPWHMVAQKRLEMAFLPLPVF